MECQEEEGRQGDNSPGRCGARVLLPAAIARATSSSVRSSVWCGNTLGGERRLRFVLRDSRPATTSQIFMELLFFVAPGFPRLLSLFFLIGVLLDARVL